MDWIEKMKKTERDNLLDKLTEYYGIEHTSMIITILDEVEVIGK